MQSPSKRHFTVSIGTVN